MSDIAADPFNERTRRLTRVLPILGSVVRFESNSLELLEMVDHAFAGLPASHLSAGSALRVVIMLEGEASRAGRRRPPAVRLTSGAGLLTGQIDGFASLVIDPDRRRAVAMVNHDMLRFPYHLRYEVIELVTLTLAARVQRLVPLHAACVAQGDRAVLLLGDSGAGKSTLTMLALSAGLQVVAEDSAFATRKLAIIGAPSRLHLSAGTLRLLPDAALRRRIRASPVVERRSGARKLAWDLRREPGSLAKRVPRVTAVLLLKARQGQGRPRLRVLPGKALRRVLRRTQPYALHQQGWKDFERRLCALPAFSLARGSEPGFSVDALRSVLDGSHA